MRTSVGVLLLSLSGLTASAQTPVDDVALTWRVVSNVAEDGFRSELVVHNRSDSALPAEGWTLYFNYWREIVPPFAEGIAVDHVNGDFYGLRPTAAFAAIAPGESRTIPIVSRDWTISESDAPDGFYFVWGDPETGTIQALDDPAVEALTTLEQTSRTRNDRRPVDTPAQRYADNQAISRVDVEAVPLVVPRPARLTQRAGELVIDAGWRIVHDPGLADEADYLATSLEPLLGRPLVVGHEGADATRSITLRLDPSRLDPSLGVAEAYRLDVVPGAGITITGASRAGVFYGVQSLRLAIAPEAYARRDGTAAVPALEIEDGPRFGYRGLHLDAARNFQPVDQVRKLLDLMATYKLNKFHLHLSDDEGWRLAVADLPELVSVGSRRAHTLSESEHLMPSLGSGPTTDSRGSGHYTRDELIEILRFAAARHIDVIPEIDMPGHARAAIVAMRARQRRLAHEGRLDAANEFALADPGDASVYRSVQMWSGNVVDVCLDSTYRFLETVVAELVSIYAQAGVPLDAIHTGGDEVPAGAWAGSPSCARLIESSETLDGIGDLKAYFIDRFDAILDRYGIGTAGWEEIALTEVRSGDRVRKAPNPALVDDGVTAYVWNAVWGWGAEDTAYELANAGFPVVLANATHFYFDLAYAKHPGEPGLYWAGFVDTKDPFAFMPLDLYEVATEDLLGRPIAGDRYDVWTSLTDRGRANIIGIQGQLWSENIRSDERLEYMVLPRMIALAERAWAPQPPWATIADDARRNAERDVDWNLFANALGRRELPRLDYLHGGVRYRIPPPGARVSAGMLEANAALPGFTIRYTRDGTEPTIDSAQYTGPVDVGSDLDELILLRAFSVSGRGSRTVRVVR